MTEVEILTKDVSGFKGDAWHVKRGDEHFIVSGVNAMFSGWEVLVFPADEEGKVKSFIDVAGGRGLTHEEAIEQLADNADEAE